MKNKPTNSKTNTYIVKKVLVHTHTLFIMRTLFRRTLCHSVFILFFRQSYPSADILYFCLLPLISNFYCIIWISMSPASTCKEDYPLHDFKCKMTPTVSHRKKNTVICQQFNLSATTLISQLSYIFLSKVAQKLNSSLAIFKIMQVSSYIRYIPAFHQDIIVILTFTNTHAIKRIEICKYSFP